MATNRLTSASYDVAGNLLTWNGQKYDYDRLNKMTRSCASWNGSSCAAEDWLHVYTADDERIWSYRVAGGGSLFTLRGLDRRVLRGHEAHLGWTVFTDSLWGPSGLVSTVASPRVVKHWSTDELGTPRIHADRNFTKPWAVGRRESRPPRARMAGDERGRGFAGGRRGLGRRARGAADRGS